MVALSQISKIGFGGYRIDRNDKNHWKSLEYALKNGCNLVETASNYRGGRSEQLMGEVLKANPEVDAFVVTKTGYVHNSELKEVISLHQENGVSNQLIKVNDGLYYSIDPIYLERQIKRSLQNLQTDRIDGFLLHNPEYLLQGEKQRSKDDFYLSLKRAFTFLEEKVQQNQIRYYGVSSNTLCQIKNNYFIDFKTLKSIAAEVSTNNHFKLIEFPFNLLEQEALENYGNNLSMIDVLKKYGMRILSNRPFNANGVNGPLRLATYDEEIRHLDIQTDDIYYVHLKDDISKELENKKFDGAVDDFEVIQFLNKSWMNFESIEQKDEIINRHLIPFLNEVFDQKLPSSLSSFLTVVEAYVRRNITNRANTLRSQNEAINSLDKDKTFTQILCEYYLSLGIDLVLVGMRKEKYVKELKYLF